MLCMNDDNGNCIHKASALNFEHGLENILEFEGEYINKDKHITCYSIDDNWFRFGRLTLYIYTYNVWVGNIYWNMIELPYREWKRAVLYLKCRGNYQCVGGISKAVDWWDKL